MKYTVLPLRVIKDLNDCDSLALFTFLLSGELDQLQPENIPHVIRMSRPRYEKAFKKLQGKGYLRVDGSKITVSDDPDPLANHAASTTLFPDQDHELVRWIRENCPRVARMQKPITNVEATKLQNMTAGVEMAADVIETLEAMENYAKLHNNVSAYKTLINWMDRSNSNPVQSNNDWADITE